MMENTFDLAYELKKCKECSCSRCNLNGTPGCYIDIAIKELGRYDQAMDSLTIPTIINGGITWDNDDAIAYEAKLMGEEYEKEDKN